MLSPKKVKFRKWQTGRRNMKNLGRSSRGTVLSFGSFGLKALSSFRLRATQIEAARKTIAHSLNREGRIFIRIFPDKPITKLPPEVTLGGGKGEVDHYVFNAKPGRVLFEVDGVPLENAKEALRKAGHKMPVKTRFISK